MQTVTQTYNDGVLAVYSVDNSADGGRRPIERLSLKIPTLRYEERTVGINRYWTGIQNAVRIDRLLRVPRHESVSNQDAVILHNGERYTVQQVQYPTDVTPPSMDLSLERTERAYEITQGNDDTT